MSVRTIPKADDDDANYDSTTNFQESIKSYNFQKPLGKALYGNTFSKATKKTPVLNFQTRKQKQ